MIIDQVMLNNSYLETPWNAQPWSSIDAAGNTISWPDISWPLPVLIDPLNVSSVFDVITFDQTTGWLVERSNSSINGIMIELHIQGAFSFRETYLHGNKVELSFAFMTVVIICNAIKAAVMFATLQQNFSTFLTIGDAIASFMETPDRTTVGFCTMPKEQITTAFGQLWKSVRTSYGVKAIPSHLWVRKDRQWNESIGMWRWLLGMTT